MPIRLPFNFLCEGLHCNLYHHSPEVNRDIVAISHFTVLSDVATGNSTDWWSARSITNDAVTVNVYKNFNILTSIWNQFNLLFVLIWLCYLILTLLFVLFCPWKVPPFLLALKFQFKFSDGIWFRFFFPIYKSSNGFNSKKRICHECSCVTVEDGIIRERMPGNFNKFLVSNSSNYSFKWLIPWFCAMFYFVVCAVHKCTPIETGRNQRRNLQIEFVSDFCELLFFVTNSQLKSCDLCCSDLYLSSRCICVLTVFSNVSCLCFCTANLIVYFVPRHLLPECGRLYVLCWGSRHFCHCVILNVFSFFCCVSCHCVFDGVFMCCVWLYFVTQIIQWIDDLFEICSIWFPFSILFVIDHKEWTDWAGCCTARSQARLFLDLWRVSVCTMLWVYVSWLSYFRV